MILTVDEALTRSGFTEYRKTALTLISDITFPAGTVYQTPEGLRAEDEETRCAFDIQGGIYPIRESVFQASYEPITAAKPADAGRLSLDVGRLDLAMAAAGIHVDAARPKITRHRGCQSCQKGIRAIAREYAALASPTAPANRECANCADPVYCVSCAAEAGDV